MLTARIAFSDNARERERATHFEAHKQHLRSGSIRILQSGPFRKGDLKGALIVAEVQSIEEMQAFSQNDPFVVHKVYDTVHVVEWTVTFSQADQPSA